MLLLILFLLSSIWVTQTSSKIQSGYNYPQGTHLEKNNETSHFISTKSVHGWQKYAVLLLWQSRNI